MAYDIIKELQVIVNTASKGDSSYDIAKTILNSIYTDLESLSIGDLADRAYTSVSTVSRFTKILFCDNFNELKKKCLDSKRRSIELMQDNLDGMNFDLKNDKQILVKISSQISNDLNDFAKNINFDDLDNLIDLIHDYNEVNFFGVQLTGYFMQHLQYTFMNMGKYINFRLSENDSYSLVKESSKNTLAVIFSVDGNFTHTNASLFYEMKEKGAKVILVTQNTTLKVASHCDKVIYIGSYTNSKSGKYKLQLFSEILVNKYYMKYKKEISFV